MGFVLIDYSKYGVDQFVSDPCFRDWVLNRGNPSSIYWWLWLSYHPEKLSVVKEARTLLFSLNPSYCTQAEGYIESAWLEILN